jgi:geranylgeranyl pyrophosphate synthase
VNYIIDQVTKHNGIDYATKKMNEFRDEALDILHSFPKIGCKKCIRGTCTIYYRQELLSIYYE